MFASVHFVYNVLAVIVVIFAAGGGVCGGGASIFVVVVVVSLLLVIVYLFPWRLIQLPLWDILDGKANINYICVGLK